MQEFGQDIVRHPWIEVLECEDANQKARPFHDTIVQLRDKYFPLKLVRISSLDNEWMHPALKSTYMEMTKDYYKNPAYGRKRISRPMRIVGPIQFWRGCVKEKEKKKK